MQNSEPSQPTSRSSGAKLLFRTRPFFWLLIPVFFLLKNTNIYFGLIPATQLACLFVRYLVLSLVLYLVLCLPKGKQKYKAALYSLVFLSLYFFFSPLDDFIQRQSWLTPLNRYRYFLPFIALCVVLAVLLIRKTTRPPLKTILFLNLLLSLFCAVEIIRLCGKAINPPKPLLAMEARPAFQYDSAQRLPHPDIYFLLFDEYQGNAGLQDQFHFDNAGLIQALKSDSFYIPAYARSNYNFTFFSMPSIFNMSYIQGDIQGKDDLEKTLKMASGIKLIERASLFDFLQKNGYAIVNLSPFTLDHPGDGTPQSGQTTPQPEHSMAPSEHITPQPGERISQYHSITAEKDLITSQTIFYGLTNKFAWQIDNKAWLDLTNPMDYNNRYYNRYVEDHLLLSLPNRQTQSPTRDHPIPTFTYAHFFMPHSPYEKDSSGNDIPFKYLMQDHPADIGNALYLGYIKYCNTALIGIVRKIIQADPGSVIIVMSDHGLRNGSPQQFNNLCSIRVPGGDYSQWPDTVDAVNVFRILLNTQLGQRLDYLPYRSIRFDLSPKSAAQ